VRNCNPLLVIFFIISLIPKETLADGNRLLTYCKAMERYNETGVVDNEFSVGFCLGAINGVRTSVEFTRKLLEESRNTRSLMACIPKNGVTLEQTIRIVLRYLESHPADLHYSEGILIMFALKEAFPCE
jgi:hypothetical protein